MKVQTRQDSKRGCGFRKEGGYYLISEGLSTPCGKLPIPLTVCPCCNAGVKFARSWTWINLALFTEKEKCDLPAMQCRGCPMNAKIERCGLLWIGEKFYTPQSFTEEAARLGVSRRIATVPREFKLGETYVAVAHIQCSHGAMPGLRNVQTVEREVQDL